MFLAQLTTTIARREASGHFATRGQLLLLSQLVSSDFRHRVVARDLPAGSGDTPIVATVTSYAPDGSVLDEVLVVLEPDGSGGLRMRPELVLIDPGTRDPRTPAPFGPRQFHVPSEADGLVFLTSVEGSRVVARAPDLQDGEAHVVAGP